MNELILKHTFYDYVEKERNNLMKVRIRNVMGIKWVSLLMVKKII